MKQEMKLPCGCGMVTIHQTFYIKPCSLNCKYYLYAMEQSKKQENKIIKKRIK